MNDLSKIAMLSDQIREMSLELATMRQKLRTVHTNKEGVWFWRGDGNDDIEALSCPVVMDAETLDLTIKQARKEGFEEAAEKLSMCSSGEPWLESLISGLRREAKGI
jgi:division protein CdvB (Snf7/Vps24/ESCRT-III family)